MASRFARGWRFVLAPSLAGAVLLGLAASRADTADDVATAKSLAAMLRAARTVVSRHQGEINDPDVGDKGLTSDKMLAEAVAGYKQATGEDPNAVDPTSKRGRLLRAQMDAIREVWDANQSTIDEKGLGFKGFIPATFGRLVNESFERRAAGEASVKDTAPPDLVRNRKAEPDAWERQVIAQDFLSPNWPKGKEYSAVVESQGRTAFRMAVPEYYVPSCLSCHGEPKGDIDVTGYPKEGGKAGDLGSVISITLFR
ncbi:MAG: DUF3365 domain-containing protein [Hyphomicrobiales bacterium]|nr:DUF3365 domain-containing protein [Hyphomicrobiales bacterium]